MLQCLMSRAQFMQDLGTSQMHSGSAGISSLIQQKLVLSLPLLLLLPSTLYPVSIPLSLPSLNLTFSYILTVYVFDQLIM